MIGKVARLAGVGLALLGAAALVVAAVVLLSGRDEVAPVVIVAPEPTAEPLVEARDVEARDVRVHVSGAVMLPGVYTMSEGDRVVDAVAAAGGVRADANISSVNLALRVLDESHYHIPFQGETPMAPAAASLTPGGVADRSGGPSDRLIDLNTAMERELESLPGIGPDMAGRIVAHREANGPFVSVEDVENVSGIGPKTLESLRPLVTVSGGR